MFDVEHLVKVHNPKEIYLGQSSIWKHQTLNYLCEQK